MTDDVKVTICSLAFNHEKYIRRTLEGIVSQKTDFKFIAYIHDDASTDSTADIIREYAEKYPDIIKPVLQTENQYRQGKSISRDILIPMVTSKYITYCECDDYWTDENKLQKQYDIMESNPDLAMCTHLVQGVDVDENKMEQTFPDKAYNLTQTGRIPNDKFADLLFLKGGYPFHTSSYFHRTEMVQNDFAKKFIAKINGDQRIVFSALFYGDIYYINESMSCRRLMVPGSYNDRLKQKTADQKLDVTINTLKATVLFDKLSNGKHHAKVVEGICRVFFHMFRTNGSKKVIRDFKAIDKTIKYDWKISNKMNVKYILMKYFPHVLSLAYRIKR